MEETYKSLTDFLTQIRRIEFGKWQPESRKGDGSSEHPFQMPHVVYVEVVDKLVHEIYAFEKEHPEYGLNRYSQILEQHGIEWGIKSMAEADVSQMDGQGVMALFVGAARAERFCDGALLDFFEIGCIEKWMERLKEIDVESGRNN